MQHRADTETKTNYITVIDTTDAPHANFVADFTSLMAGNTTNFTNLSTGFYDSLLWIFEGAIPNTSTNQNPSGIQYPNTGCYDVTLILYSFLGNDTLTKPNYICVFDPNNLDSIHANFHAITNRLIVQGQTVSYEDLSVGPITSWNWYFEGGTPSTSTVQNPSNITYSTPGIYDVRLIISNGMFSDTLVKQDYIVVTTGPWPDPNGFCDTISNIRQGEHPLTFIHLAPNKWGYVPGHNQLNYKYYADKHTNYTFSYIRGLLVPVVKAYGASPNNKVRFIVWDVDSLTGKPGNILGYKDEIINNFTPLLYKSVIFNNPIPVNGKFFVGFQLWYNSPVDTFVVYMAPNRGINGTNTLYMAKATNDWKTLTQFFADTLVYNTSLAIQIVGCLVGIEEQDLQQQMVIYPNPVQDQLYVEFIDVDIKNISFEIYDLMGRNIKANYKQTQGTNQFILNLGHLTNGVYLLKTKINGIQLTNRFIKL